MAPPILQLDDIGLSFGGEPLLEGVALQIELGQRICLVGRNGSGKSTLLRIAAGEIEPQEGEVFRQPGLTFSHLLQEPDFAEGERTVDHVEKGLNATDRPQAAERLMEELGLDSQALAAQLSGGEQRRVALARALVGRPDLLLLDEPTNHLDLPTIEWLEGKLKGQPGAIVMISHDRRFLEEMTNSVIWLERGRTRRLAQGFKAFEEWRETLLAEEEKAHHRLGRKVKREEDWLRYGVTARRKRNVRRLAALKSAREEFKSARGGPARAVLDPVIAERSGTFVLEAKNVSFAYGDRTIVQDFDLRMHRGDRIGIVGANGAGKTTLLGLLTATLKPDEGRVRHGSNLALAALDQDRSSLDGAQTLGDFLASGHGDEGATGSQPRHVSTLMKDFLFDPAQLRQPIATLSGGERGRLMLARLLTRPSNFLILDEPTNDLDMETLDLLQEKIAEYAGTVLLISHDRDFLDRTVTAIVAPEENGKWQTYAGGYSDMVAQREKTPFAADKASSTQIKSFRKGGEGRPAKTGKPAEKLSFGQKFRLDNLPGEMERLRIEIAAAESRLGRPDFFARDPHGFNEAASALDQNRTRLEEAENEWLELEILRESLGST